MGVNLQGLVNGFRAIADDTVPTYDWSDLELEIYANEAETEATRRARLLKDSTTADLAYGIALPMGSQFITLDPRVIYVRAVHLASKSQPIVKQHKSRLDRMFPGWDLPGANNLNLGDINHYCLDHDSGQLWFDAPSPADDTVYLTVVRTPLVPMAYEVDQSICVITPGTSTLTATTTGTNTVIGTNTYTATATLTASVDGELPVRYKYALIQWMIYRAYEKQDSETNDPEKSASGLAKFEAEFGVKMSAQNEQYENEQEGYDPDDGTY